MAELEAQALKKAIMDCVDRMGVSVLAFPWENKQAYGQWLAQTYYFVRHTTSFLGLTASRFGHRRRDLQYHQLQHLRGEADHDMLLLNDLGKLGFKFQDFPELPETAALYQMQYYFIEHENPASHFGYAYCLEGLAAKKVELFYKRVEMSFSADASRANWQKRWRGGTKNMHFIIKREDLLADGELSAAARTYLDQLGPTCDVSDLLRRYSEKLEQFYAWLLFEVEEHLPIEVKDYQACCKAVKRQHGKLSYEVMIGLWTQAGADPYEHLPKHLTSEQMKEAEALPHRSRQQADYIIACLDKDGACDDHLRTVVYKFFKVDSSGECPTP